MSCISVSEITSARESGPFSGSLRLKYWCAIRCALGNDAAEGTSLAAALKNI